MTAAVKSGVSYDVCSGLDASAGRQLTAQKVGEAIEWLRTESPKPYKPDLPMKVRIRMQTLEYADLAAAKPGVKRIDAVTVEKLVEQQCDVVKWIVGHGLNMPPKES